VLTQELDTSTPPSHGVLVEPWPEFQEFQDLVLTDQDRPLSVICVEVVECLPPYTHGEDGTEESISSKRDTPSLLLSLPQVSYHSFWPEVTESAIYLNCHWLLITPSDKFKRPEMLLQFSRDSDYSKMS